MKQLAVMILAAVLFVTCIAAQAATLKTEATVGDDRIRVGDLFDGADAAVAGKVVGQAPSPGRRTTLDALTLQRIAQAYRLDWRPASNLDTIVVARSSSVVTAEMMRDAIAREMAGRIDAPRIEVELDNRMAQMDLPGSGGATVRVEGLNYDPRDGRFVAAVAAQGASGETGRINIAGRAFGMVQVPVLNRRFGAGEVITAADIAWTDLRQSRVDADTVTGETQVIGRTPRRQVAANTPIHQREVQAPQIVARNALVTMTLESRSMTLTAQGRALQEGALGDVIRVMNTQSNRTIEARVTGINAVAVSPRPLPASDAAARPMAPAPGTPRPVAMNLPRP